VFARAAKSDESIKAVLADAILYKIDCEKGEGIELAQRFGVKGYPTFKMINAKAEELACWIGYEGPGKWVEVVKTGIADQRTLVAKAAAYEEEPTLALATTLAHAASTKYDFAGAVKYFTTARPMDPNPISAAGYTESITFDDVDAEAKQVMAHPMAPLDAKLGVASMAVSLAKNQDLPERAIPYLKRAMEMSANSKSEDVLAQRAELAIDHALLVDKDGAKAVELKRAGMDEGWLESAGALNEFAWFCFENNVNLEEAEELAIKGVALAETDGERANILDTAAELCNALGNCEEAVARIKRAIELDPDKEYFQQQLARFEEAVQAKQG